MVAMCDDGADADAGLIDADDVGVATVTLVTMTNHHRDGHDNGHDDYGCPDEDRDGC